MPAAWSPTRLRRRRLTAARRLDLLPLEERLTPDVTGTVFRDNNFDGRLTTANDQPFYAGVVLTATDAAGNVATGTTSATGAYTINTTGLTGRLRVELSVPAGFADGPVGVDSDTSVRFLTGPTQSGVNFGLVNPLDYSQAAPDLVTPTHTFGPYTGGAAGSGYETNPTAPALWSFPYTSQGTPNRSPQVTGTTAAPTTLARYGQVGTTYGVGWRTDSQDVYLGAYVRRFADLGPGGSGAVYRVPRAGLPAGSAPILINLNVVPPGLLAAGDSASAYATENLAASPREFAARTGQAGYDWQNDAVGKALAHRRGLGDVEVSADGRTLYLVNLYTKELIEVPLAADGSLDTTSGRTLRRTAVPTATGTPADERPFALSVHDGAVFVGSTFTAETAYTAALALPSGTPAQVTARNNALAAARATLRAYIFAFDPASGAFRSFDTGTNQFTAAALTPTLTADLSYQRRNGTVAGSTIYETTSTATPPTLTNTGNNQTDDRGRVDDWNGWNSDTSQFRNHQPLLTDIEFDRGVAVLGVRDRYGDLVGWFGATPAVSDTGSAEGDVLRAHPAAGGFTLESGGVSNGVTNSIGGAGSGAAQYLPQGPGGARFYWSANLYEQDVDGERYGFAHSFLAMGGLFQVPGGTRLASTIMDPVRYSTGGISWFDNLTGARPQNYELYADGELGKANGLGDLQGFTAAAPLEVGNRVWFDADGDGRQGAAELGIGGVLVILTDAAGTPIPGATATTAPDGSYIFSGFAGTSTDSRKFGLALQRGTSYRVVIPNATGANQQTALSGRTLSPRRVDGAAGTPTDSDAAASGSDAVIAFTTGGTGQNDHTLDAGFVTAATADVTVDKSTTTPTVTAGGTAAFTVTISNLGTATATSVTLDDLMPGGAAVTWQIASNPSGAFQLSTTAGAQQLTLAQGTTLAGGASLTVTLTAVTEPSASPFTVTLTNTARVGAANDSDSTNNSDQASVAVLSPDVVVTKTADAATVPDAATVGFTVTLRNAGQGDAVGLQLDDLLPDLGGGSTWSIDLNSPDPLAFQLVLDNGRQRLQLVGTPTLAPGGTRTVRVTGTSTTQQTTLQNTARGSATNESTQALANNSQTATVTVTVRDPDVTVSKTPLATPVVAGGQVGYSVVLSNIGPNPATGLTLTDPLPDVPGGWTIDPTSPNAVAFQIVARPGGGQALQLAGAPTLAGGASLTVRVLGTSEPSASPFTQDLSNTAQVGAGNEPVANQGNNSSTAVVRVNSPDVVVTKVADAANVQDGQAVGFTVTIRNDGPGTARGLQLTDPLPALGGGNRWTLAAGGGVFQLVDLPGGGQGLQLVGQPDLAPAATLTARVTGTSTSLQTDLRNTASATATNESTQATANNSQSATITVGVRPPDVTVTKSPLATPVVAGRQVGYTLVLSNLGPNPATGLTLTDPLPDVPGGWTIDPTSPDAGAFQIVARPGGGQAVQMVGAPTLAGGASLTVRVLGTSGPSASPFTQDLLNTAQVGAGNEPVANQGNNSSSATVRVLSPDVVVTKTADAASVQDGQAVGFTITLRNDGPGTATAVSLTDLLPALGGGNTWTLATGAGLFQLTLVGGQQRLELVGTPDLAPGATLTARVTGTSTTQQTDLRNTASATATNESTQATANNSQSAAIAVTVRPPDVTVTKTAAASPVTAGGLAGFTLTISNIGPNAATGLTLTDLLPDLGGTASWSIDQTFGDFAAFQIVARVGGGQTLQLAGAPTLAGGASLAVRVVGTTGPGGSPFSRDLTNTAQVGAGNEPVANQGNNSSTAVVTVVSPDVTVTKSPDAPTVSANQSVGFSLLVRNIGQGAASGLTLTDPLPDLGGGNRYSIDPASPDAAAFQLVDLGNGRQGLTLVGRPTLAAGGLLAVRVVGFSSPTSGRLDNTATVGADNEDPSANGNNASQATITVQTPDVTATKTAEADPVTAGGTVGFVVTLRNTGPGDAFGVALDDPLPAAGGAWAIDQTFGDFAAFRLDGQTLRLVGLPTLAAGASLTVRVRAVAAPSADPYSRTLTNVARVTATNEPAANQSNNSGTATVTVRSPDVVATKTPDAPSVTAGQTVGFTVTVRNAGAVTATGVTLSDPLPPLGGGNLYTLDPFSPDLTAFDLTGPAGAQVLTLKPNATLAAGAQLRVRVSGTSTTSATTLTNTATVGAANEVPTSNNTATTTVTVGALSLGDRVFRDDNNDGVRQPGEGGVSGVVVVLLDAADQPLRTATTDASGLYLFSGLPVGDYRVRITPPAGLVSSTGTNGSATGPFEMGLTDFSAATNDRDHGITDPGAVTVTTARVRLAATGNPDDGGSANRNLDFGLFAPLSLGDTVWIDTNNNGVFDSGEAGASGVVVDLFDGGGTRVGTTTTNVQGGYLFSYLQPGDYRVALPATNFQAGGPLAGFTSSTGTVGSASGPFEAVVGDPADGRDHGTRQPAGQVLGPVKTLTRGGAPLPLTPIPGAIPDPADPASSYRNQDFGVFRPLSLGNLVWEDVNNSGTRDVGEPGLPGLVVTLFSGATAVATTTTDANGGYLFSFLVEGDYTVQVAAPPGYRSSSGTRYDPLTGPFESGLTTNSDVNETDHARTASGDVISGVVVRTLPVTLGPAGTNPDGDANLRQDVGLYRSFSLGNVVWLDANNNGRRDAGEPGIAGVEMQLLDGTTALGTTTDANGYYRFDNLPAGTYRVRASRLNNVLDGLVSSTGGVGSPFEPAPQPTADSTDAGTTSGGFITSVEVPLGPTTNAPTGETDLGPGGQGTVDNQADLTLDFGFYRPLSIGDQVWEDADNDGVLDPGEAPLAAVTVRLLDAAGATVGTQTTTSGGYYLFTGLGAGTYTVEVVPPAGYAPSSTAVAAGNTLDGRNNGTLTNGVSRSRPIVLAAGTAPTGEPATPGFPDQTDGDSNKTVDFGFFRGLSLGDLVWEDRNNDGGRQAGEPGIGGVLVTLLREDGTTVGTTTTAADGGYLFTGLGAGRYRVRVQTPAGYFTSTGQNGSATGPSEAAPATATNNQDHGTLAGTAVEGPLVSLQPGQAPTGEATSGPVLTDPAADADSDRTQDFGFFRPLALGNVVWEDANNNGRRDAGEPGLGGVAVTLTDGGGTVVGTATTDPGGGYRFDLLTPGAYVVAVAPPAGYVSSTGRVGSATGPVEPAVGNSLTNDEDHGSASGGGVRANPVTLGDPGTNPDESGSANLRQDFGLFRPLALGNLVWEDANNNGVRDAGEPGLGGVAVTLLDAAGATVAQATTDPTGGYRFDNLVTGTYTVRVAPPTGYVTSSGTNGSASGPFEPGLSGTEDNQDHGTATAAGVVSTVTLTATGNPDGGSANLRQDFGLYRPLSVGNQVWRDDNNNGRFDAGEPVLSGVLVRLLDAGGSVVGTATTDSSGRYAFTLLAPGTHRVQVTPPTGLVPSTAVSPPLAEDGRNVGTASGGVVLSAPFMLAVGAGPNGGNDFPTVDFGLLNPTPPTGSVAGRVYVDVNLNGAFDSGDKPLGGIVVTATGPGGTFTATTDSAGRYSFPSLPPGSYTIRERRPGGILQDFTSTPGTLGGAAVDLNTLTVNVGAGQAGTDYNFAVVTPTRVFGTVFADLNRSGGFDAADAGIAGVPVTISGTAFAGTSRARPLTAADVPGGLTAITGATGRYEFPSLPPGQYTVSQGSLPAAAAAVLTDSTDYSGDPAVPSSVVANNAFNNFSAPAGNARGPLVFAWVPSTGTPATATGTVDPTKREFLSSTQARTTTTVTVSTPAATAGNQTPSFSVGTGNAARPTYVVAGSGAGGTPLVRVLDYGTGVERFRFLAYEVAYTGGVRVATGDVTGDGVPDVLTTTGLGGGPRVRVFDGVTGDSVSDFFAYESTFTGGLFLAVGDIDGDGVGDIVTGTEVGGGPRVQAFSGKTGAVLANYFAFDAAQRGGVRVASADFNKDGRADVVATTGVGVQTRVRVLDGLSGAVLADYAPYEAAYTGGVYVAAGDFDGDGTPDVVVGADAGGGPRVQVFSGTTQTVLADFFAYDQSERGGVRVAAKDLTGDGKAEVVTATGSVGRSGVKAFRGADLSQVEGFDFTSDDRASGAYVG